MNTKDLLLSVFVLLTVLFASLTVSEYIQINHLSAQQATQSAAVTYFYAPSVVIPAPCCPSIPENFVVGTVATNTYRFNVMALSPPLSCQSGEPCTTRAGILLAFKVNHVYNHSGLPHPSPQWANFTWEGTFSETAPSPSGATLFDGALSMNWFVKSSVLYLNITTR